MTFYKQLIIIVLLATSFNVNAQYGFYGSLATGPSIELQKTKVNGQEISSFGQGINTQIRVGAFISYKLSAELGLGYVYGDRRDLNESILKLNGKGRSLRGLFTLNYYPFEKGLYFKAGLIGGIRTRVLMSGEITLPNDKINFERTDSGKFSLGGLAGVGYRYRFGDNGAVFAEVNYEGLNIKANKSKLKNLGGLTKSQVEEKFTQSGLPVDALRTFISEEYNYDDLNVGSDKYMFPYSALGLTIGVSYLID